MLRLELNTANDLYIVCNDLLTISSPIYLWRIYNEQTKEERFIELSNQQPLNPRFDLFTLTLPTDLDLEEGIYFWNVYQSPTPAERDIENMVVLANGQAKVLATFEENETYEPTGTDTVYQG